MAKDCRVNQLVDLFNVDVYGNIRRVQGLIRSAGKEIHAAGREVAIPRILAAIAEMRRVGRVRVPYFCDLLARLKAQNLTPDRQRDIVRQPGNPFLRYARHEGDAAEVMPDPIPPTQESLL